VLSCSVSRVRDEVRTVLRYEHVQPFVLRERHTLILGRALLSASEEAIIALQLISRLRAHRHDDLPRVDEAGRGQRVGRRRRRGSH